MEEAVEHRVGLLFENDIGRERNCVVHQDVKAAPRVDRRPHRSRDLLFVAYVARHEQPGASKIIELRRNLFARWFVDLGHNDLGALRGEAPADPATDAFPATGDQCDLALQPPHAASSPCASVSAYT